MTIVSLRRQVVATTRADRNPLVPPKTRLSLSGFNLLD